MPLTDKQVREKLVTRCAQALTDAELLSVLLQRVKRVDRLWSCRKSFWRHMMGI